MSERAKSSDKRAEKQAKIAEHQRDKYMRTMANRRDVLAIVGLHDEERIKPLYAAVRALELRVKALEDRR